jgi:hypothetical protein
MTDEAQARHQTATAIIRSLTIKTGLIVGIAASAALVFLLVRNNGEHWWSIPASMLFGGALGMLNFRWLTFTIERMMARKEGSLKPSGPVATVVNGLKLVAIFIVIFVVIRWQLVDIFGLIIGLSLCFLAIIWEGLTLVNDMHNKRL